MIPELWEGDRDDRNAPHPARGTWVVYLLADDAGDVQYVGMSGHWWARIHGHRRNRWWTSWVAQRCADKADAELTEAELIADLRPPYNVAGK